MNSTYLELFLLVSKALKNETMEQPISDSAS